MLARGALALWLGLAAATTAIAADSFPSRPITLVVPFAAGGPGDTVGRLLAAAMSRSQPVVVENISGAGGNIGATRVARAAPDGYTLLFHQLGMAVSPSLYSKLEYDALNDFDYVGLVAFQPNVIVTRPDLPAKTFPEFLDYLRAHAKELAFANTGPGGASHLCAILFMSATGIDMKSIPYRATSLALNDVLGGQVDLLCDLVATATPYIEAGKVKAWGVSSKARAASLPELPSLAEQGLDGVDMVTWTALYAPKGLPKPVHETLVSLLQGAVTDPAFQASLRKIGSAAWPKEQAAPEALSAYLRQEMARWRPIIEKAKIRGE